MKKVQLKLPVDTSWWETGTLPSPCIPARKQRPGRAKGSAKEVTRARRRAGQPTEGPRGPSQGQPQAD
jgi:hypothetical protein